MKLGYTIGEKVIKMELEIIDYLPENGLAINWEPQYKIATKVINNDVIRITANRDGLISLAKHLLTLALKEVKPGTHIHYDENNSLDAGSNEMIVEKI